MERRTFVKLAVLTSGLTAAGYLAGDLMQIANTSVQSLTGSLDTDPSAPMNPDWQIPHLLRRAGFGGSPDEISAYQNLGLSGAIDQLVNYQSIDDSSLPAELNITMERTKKPSPSDTQKLVWWWVDRMVNTPRPLEEKLTLFWHNHFATAIYKVRSPYLMFKQNQVLRTNATSNFRDLLMEITKDPAMLIWLDGAKNRAAAPNENYGREVMEVFTIGVGNYTEDDVKGAARAFTGYQINKFGESFFNSKVHDDGPKTFLGQTGNFGPEDIVNILANHPATAKRIASELFSYLSYSNPSSEVANNLASVFTNSNGNIGAVVEAILKSDEFMSSYAHLSLVKSPVDYVVTAMRSLGASVKPRVVIGTLKNMGQLPFNPPSVFGWPEGIGWINTSTILDRYNFPLAIDASSVQAVQAGASASDVAQVLFPEGLPSDVLQVIQNSSNSLNNPTAQLRDMIRLTMSTPYYNLN
ncbi:MAG: DUF1800 domain-containing protein [Candidatus Bathyarchaeia archaeon]